MLIRCLYDKLVSVDSLKAHPQNRNQHPEDQIERLAKILNYQGWRYPIKVSKQSGFITSGHGRLSAALKNGWNEVPVNYQDYDSTDQEYADVQADNAIASWAELDLGGVNGDLEQLGPNFDLDLLGIKDFVLEPAEKFHTDEDDVPEVKEGDKRVTPGQLFILGRHRLLCGDATKAEDVEKLTQGQKADMVFTDPPYNLNYEGKTADALTIQNDHMDGESFLEFLHAAFKNYLASIKPGSAIYVCHADTEGLNVRNALKEAGWDLKQCLVWVKQSLVMGRQDYHWQHEPILYAWAPGASHKWYGDRKQTSVWSVDRPTRSAEHPTMKPIELIEKGLLNSSKPGDLVLDFFGGSGSTLITCEKNNRKCQTMELDPHYCSVILDRWAQFTNKDPVREDGRLWSDITREANAEGSNSVQPTANEAAGDDGRVRPEPKSNVRTVRRKPQDARPKNSRHA